MDPIVTAQVLRAAGIIAMKMDALADTLDVIGIKQDQLISREIKAAYGALHDAILSSNPDTRQRRLAFAEDNLLRNTRLNLQLDTDGIPNRSLISASHYGLAFITFLRNDDAIAARHLLQCFEVDSRFSRESLAPRLYEQLFFPHCKQIIQAAKKELQKLDKVGTERESPGTLFEYAEYWYNKAIGDDPDIVTQEDYNAEVERIEEERENAIDNRCSEIARELLV